MKTVFMHATGYKTAENVGTYFGAAEEARYLTGIAAAKASKSGKIGYVFGGQARPPGATRSGRRVFGPEMSD